MLTVRNKIKIFITDNKITSWFYSFNNIDCEALLIHIPKQNKEGSEIVSQSQGTPYLRIHSQCLTGDVFGSKRCECGNQLHESIKIMTEHGGYIAYLPQEGRGIGLYNKLDAYALQDQGHDTFQANKLLGFPEDAREYHCVPEMLLAVGIEKVFLLTNNPDKHQALTDSGIAVEKVVSTSCFMGRDNQKYIQAKADIARHTFGKVVSI
ncbi:GTP cyclohydrolase II RibA [Serratia ureilytica]|uniref:GTP cyclohydrolase II RibA n=1 Tax=Serratia ureilytica TaxID=300181 RepID=UPI001D18051C|nr:GTP cyclohydrolase II RibA [Serratia ureilytica]MCC4106841.1 GTP cyclohydrolase II RibA [Serratia ureilytica]